MPKKIISGGQTGVDQAGLRAAKALGIPTGGWAPRGWLTETGSAPWLAEEFGLYQCPSPSPWGGMSGWQWQAACYAERTKANASEAHLTIWIGTGDSRGYDATHRAVAKHGRHFAVVSRRYADRPEDFAGQWGGTMRGRVVNVAGNRESKHPGIGAWAEAFLTEVFRLVLAASPA